MAMCIALEMLSFLGRETASTRERTPPAPAAAAAGIGARSGRGGDLCLTTCIHFAALEQLQVSWKQRNAMALEDA